jgi:histidinol-phosphatase (PHP family)
MKGLVDGHVHLQPHGERPPVDRARIERYVEQARANGVERIVFTEHLFRFREAYDALAGWWDEDPSPVLAAATHAYWLDHVSLSLPAYVRLIEEAKADGLPVRLGLEMDWIPGRAADLRRLIAPYDWDCVLGSVHWLGAFGFDAEANLAEWDRRDVAAVWEDYGRALADLAAAGLADVLAHPDLPKVFGRRPPDPSPLHRRIVALAAQHGLALEINTNGLRKPVEEIYPHPDVLRAARAAGIPITLASDAHLPERVGAWFDEAVALACAAGYDGYVAFERRRAEHIPFADLTPRPPSLEGRGSVSSPAGSIDSYQGMSRSLS